MKTMKIVSLLVLKFEMIFHPFEMKIDKLSRFTQMKNEEVLDFSSTNFHLHKEWPNYKIKMYRADA